MSIYPVILCGGAGTRLWPASRPSRPKQFLSLVGRHSSFQNTLARLKGLAGAAAPIVVSGRGHAHAVEAQLEALGLEAVVLIEPAARDSAPAMAAAMKWIEARDPEGLAVILASDHHVSDPAAFRAAVGSALEGAKAGHIVTLGVTPTYPSTAYGYIEVGAGLGTGELRRVARFVEKPGPEAAREQVAAGGLWNSGNFVVAAAILIEELRREAPEVLAAAAAAVAEGRAEGCELRLSDAFLAAPKISIDYAVMEKTSRAAVLPVDFAWSDLGAWDAVWAASSPDPMGNAVQGEAVLDGAADCLIRAAPGQLVTAVGVRNLAIVAEKDAVLVCDLASSQRVKLVVDQVKAGGHPQVDVQLDIAPPPGESVEAESLGSVTRWFRRWLMVNALPAWWTLGADRARGGFFEALDQEGIPLDLPRRSRVQTRQRFVYAQAGAMGWPGPWREAGGHAAEYLTRRFERPDGLHRTRVGPAGETLDEAVFLYDQTFALLALAEEGPAREDKARALMAAIELGFRDPAGGFVELAAPRFVSNPLMHLFEAVLAWAEVGRGEDWPALAEEIGGFALHRLVDPAGGFIAETFGTGWRALADPAARQVWPGHQFEWAWLMARWRRLGGPEAALEAARRLHLAGGRGVIGGGVTANAMGPDFTVIDRAGRLWPQTERLKSAATLAEFAAGEERARLEAEALEAAVVLRRYLATPAAGLWFDAIDAAGALVPGPAPASSFYHLIGAVRVLAGPPIAARERRGIGEDAREAELRGGQPRKVGALRTRA
ncbi:MAG: AGE family epimerase/isomerase [Caulobacteraceae bacterium]